MPGGGFRRLLFSFLDAPSYGLQVLSPNTPYQLLAMLPYVFYPRRPWLFWELRKVAQKSQRKSHISGKTDEVIEMNNADR